MIPECGHVSLWFLIILRIYSPPCCIQMSMLRNVSGNIMYMFMPDQLASAHKAGTSVAPFISRVNWHSFLRTSTIGQSVKRERERAAIWLIGSRVCGCLALYLCARMLSGPWGPVSAHFPLSSGHADSQCSAVEICLRNSEVSFGKY